MMKQKNIEFIAQVMTPLPKAIGPDVSVVKAHDVMTQNKIRHLPVMVGNRVVGILTDRNVKAATCSKWGEEFFVKDIMMPDPFVVRPAASLDEVLTQMIKYKYGSVIVQEKTGEVIGIFTAVDALWLLRQMLRGTQQLKKSA